MNYKKYNDYELIYMVRENDQSSYDILYKKYYPLIKKIAFDYYKRFSIYGYELDDFIQEALISFQIALNKYDDCKDTLFYTYVITCMERKMISFCRKISCSKKAIPVDNMVDYDENLIVDKSNDISKILEYDELFKCIKEYIYDMEFIDSCIIELKINNFSYDDISSLLDLSVRTIQFRACKMRKILKKRLSKLLIN